MKEFRLAALAVALVGCALSLPACYSQTGDETSGQTLQIQTNVGSGFNCGFATSPLYCYGIPVAIGGVPGGTFWLDTYTSGYYAGKGFIVWNGVADLAEATVTGNTPTYAQFTSAGRTATAISQLVVNFGGQTNENDGGGYSGTMTLTFSYYYSSGGGGRGGGGAGWRQVCTGGAINITYL
jgi:hypothetical protein